MAYSVQLPDGRIVSGIPDDMPPQEVKRRIQSAFPEVVGAPERSWREVATDIAGPLAKGIGSFLQLPGAGVGLVSGDKEAAEFVRELYGGKALEEFGEKLKSEKYKALEKVARSKIAEAEKEGELQSFLTTLGQYAKSPTLLAGFAAEQAPMLAGPLAGGRLAKGIASLAGAGEAGALSAGVAGAIGTGAGMQGVDIGYGAFTKMYDELIKQGRSPEQAAAESIDAARAAGAGAAAISVLTQMLPGARMLERQLVGGARTGSRLGTAGRTALGEAYTEIPEEVGGKFLENLAMQTVKPSQSLTEGLGQTAAMAGLGGGLLGGVSGLVSRGAPPMEGAQTKETDEELIKEILKESGVLLPGETEPKKKEKKKLEDLDQVQVADLRDFLAKLTTGEAVYSDSDLRSILINKGKILGFNERTMKGKDSKDLIDYLTRKITPKEEQREQPKSTEPATSGVGVGILSQTGTGVPTVVPQTLEGTGLGGITDVAQQTGVGEIAAAPTLTQPVQEVQPAVQEVQPAVQEVQPAVQEIQPTSQEVPTSVVTPTEAVQTEETGAAAPAQTTEVVAKPAAEPVVDDRKKAALDALARLKSKKKPLKIEDEASYYADPDELTIVSYVREQLRADEEVDPELFKEASDIFERRIFREENKRIDNLYNQAVQNVAKTLKARGLPVYFKSLEADERQIFIDELGKNINLASAEKALAGLVDYRDNKKIFLIDELGLKRADIRADALAQYAINREIESEEAGVEFPPWNALTQEEQTLFLENTPIAAGRSERGLKGEYVQAGFEALGNYIKAERAKLGQTNVEGKRGSAYEVAQQEITAKRMGFTGTELPPDIARALKEGNIDRVLAYLAVSSRGFSEKQPRVGSLTTLIQNKYASPLSAIINRLVAGSIRGLLDDVKIVYIPADQLKAARKKLDFIAEYNPETNTIYLSDLALNETAMLHEFVHAATVKIIYQYFHGQRDQLTPEQQAAVQSIQNLYNRLKNTGLKDSFPNAFTNIYEFVSYGITDPRMQLALQETPIKEQVLVKDNKIQLFSAWSKLVNEVASILGVKGLFSRIGKYLPGEIPAKATQVNKDIEALGKRKQRKAIDEINDEDIQEAIDSFEDITTLQEGESGRVKKAKNKAVSIEDKLAALAEAFIEDKISEKEYDSRVASIVDRANRSGLESPYFDTDIDRVVAVKQLNEQNAFFELLANFERILAAPEPIADFGATLPISSADGRKAAKQVEDRLVNKFDEQKPSLASRTKSIKNMFTREYALKLNEQLVNYRARLDQWNDTLLRAGRLISDTDKQNNVGTAVTSAAGRGATAFQKELFTPIQDFHSALRALTQNMRMPAKRVLARLHMYAIHLHDPERRLIKYLREVPLVDNAAIVKRNQLNDDLTKVKSEQEGKNALAALKAHVDSTKVQGHPLSDINNDAYNTLGPYSKDVIDNVFGKVFDGVDPKLVKNVLDATKRIEDVTIELNKKSNYFSQPVQSIIWSYGFKNYFPFKGKPDSGPTDYQLDPFSTLVGGELQDKTEAFDGRLTDSDNPFMNVLTEATVAASRFGRADAGVTLSIKNAIDQGLLKGKFVSKVNFEDRYNNRLPESLRRTRNGIFHHLPDGTVEVYEILDPDMLTAIKRPLRDTHWAFETLDRITSTIGQGHTRYNPAFAPMDFTRNLLTYAGIITAEDGIKRGGQLTAEMARVMAQNGFLKTARFSIAYASGDKATINKLVKSKDKFYQDMNEYYDLGGRVSYIQGITMAENLTDAIKEAEKNGVIKNLAGVTKVFDAWLDMFEMTSRIAAYRVYKSDFMAKGMGENQAKIEAAAKAKGLANFEKTGIKGKELGALFMFFRPAATGAVRAIEALAPGLDLFKSDAQLRHEAIQRSESVAGLKGKKKKKAVAGLTSQDIDRLVEDRKERAKSAAVAAAAAFGIGVVTYFMSRAMAGDDEEGRNKVDIDDTARWVRYARFNLGIESGGRDLVLQIPWGFGLGAFASIGAQIAAFVNGSSSFGEFLNNVLDAGLESFFPIPISKINKFEHPLEAGLDSILPSVLRPIFEYAINLDGIGREIYNGRQARNNDAYTSGDNIPEMYKSAARIFYNESLSSVDVSPNTLYFFANNYFDALSRFLSWGYGTYLTLGGEKEFDAKTDTLFLDAYLKAPSNYDAKQFSKVEEKIKEMEKRFNAFTKSNDEKVLEKYLEKYPDDKIAIDFYNKFKGQLDKVRGAANVVRKNSQLSVKERNEEVRLLIDEQNRMKSAFVSTAISFGIEP